MPVSEPSVGATGWNSWGHDVTGVVNAVADAPARLDALEAGSAGAVMAVTAANSTVTIAGTSTHPTVAVGTIAESQVTNLTTDLAAKAAKAANLSDLTDASAARTNLGLATIATSGSATNLSIGTVPTARLGAGVANSTTFLRGDQTWAVPAGGGSGGSGTVAAAVTRLTTGNLTLGNVNWTDVNTSLDLVLNASAGDWVEVALDAVVTAEAANRLYFDACTVVSGSPVNWLSSGTSVAGVHWGEAAWTMPANYMGSISGSVFYQLQSGDISGGQVRIRLRYNTDNATPTRAVGATTHDLGFPLVFAGQVLGDVATGGGSGGGADSTVVDYGADRTGSASSTTAFQNAINAGDVIMPSGTYKVGKITYEGASSRRIYAQGPVTIIQTDVSGVFELKGGWDSLGAVSSYATVNTNLVTPGESAPASTDVDVTQLTMSSAVTVAVADVLKVVADDNTQYTGDTAYRVGEYVLAGKASTASTTVTLANVLVENYVTNVRLARLWDVRFRVEGPIIFDTDPAIRDTGGWVAVLKLRAAKDCFVGGGVEFRNSLGRAIANNTYAARFDGIKFRNLANRPSLTQYGYAVADNGSLTRMSGCHAENIRHMFTSNSEGASSLSTLFEDFGASFFAHISDCVARNCQSQPFDTHGDSYGTTFENCKAIGSFSGATSGGYGFALRGRNNTCIGCYVSNSWRGFGVFAENALLQDCIARDCHYTALEFAGDITAPSPPWPTDYKKMRVVGGEYHTSGRSYQTALLGAQSGYTLNVELENVRFTKSAAPGNGPRHIEFGQGVTLTFKDLTFNWEQYGAAHTVFGFLVNGSGNSITGDGIRNMGGSSAATGFQVIGVNTGATGATSTPVFASGIEHRHSSVEAGIVDGNFTTRRSSYRQYFGSTASTRTGSNDLVLTAAASAVLPIADKLDPVIGVRLTGSAGALSLAAIPTTGLVPGQVLRVMNDSNGAVTVNSVSIAVGAAKGWMFVQGTWWALS